MHQDRPTFEVDGAAIRKHRMEAGLNIAQLAAAIGVTASYLSRIEVGTRRRMGPNPFAALRAVLNKKSKDLLLAPHEDIETERSNGHGTPQDDPPRP